MPEVFSVRVSGDLLGGRVASPGDYTDMVSGFESVRLTLSDDGRENGYDPDPVECPTCEGSGDCELVEVDPVTSYPLVVPCSACDGTGEVPGVAGWFNSASVEYDPEYDRVQLAISLGDPRGALVFDVTRLADGRVIVSLPDGMNGTVGMAHVPATDLGNGRWVLGGAA